jgi:phage shock protein E
MGIFSNFFRNADNKDLVEVLGKGAFLVDVRTPAEFSGGSVKGAVNIPLETIPRQLAKFRNKQNIVVFCKSGGRSGQAKSILEQNGFQHIINGGSWQNVQQLVDR